MQNRSLIFKALLIRGNYISSKANFEKIKHLHTFNWSVLPLKSYQKAFNFFWNGMYHFQIKESKYYRAQTFVKWMIFWKALAVYVQRFSNDVFYGFEVWCIEILDERMFDIRKTWPTKVGHLKYSLNMIP